MRLLLVEDNADHRELMRLALTEYDTTWQVEGVVSGDEALRHLSEGEAYDVVFLDYSLPGRDGLEVLEEIRRGEVPPPVVMVTGRGDEQVAVGAMKGGAYDYVVKGEGYLQRLPVVAQRAVEAHQLAVERKRAEEERERLLEQVHIGHERLRKLSQRLVEVQEVERHDLVRELHDEVGQNLTALSINLNIIRSLLPADSGMKIGDRLEDSQNLVEEIVMRIRDVMTRLRPPMLDDYGLEATLHWYCQQFSDRTGVTTGVEGKGLASRLPLEVETALFRIAQETLTNVTRHAQAKKVTIILECVAGGTRLIIADDGIGFDPQAHHQPGARPEWGLINMRERAEAIGAQLNLETAPGKGTKVTVEVPINT